MVKLEMGIVQSIDKEPSRQALVRELGVELFRGYYFAEPAFHSQAVVPSSAYR